MRLTALDITGFKSFAKPTHLEFREGITAIVGPNGSGKSNVADAIRWTLGEQSMKKLRGKKSEDVIFSGSANRGRLGMAEVSLTLANDDEGGPVDTAEIVITRQLFRSGESTYLLNNHPVRLFDVADILAKAGFGQKTYTVIGQGMADAVVNASPTERRAMFEDATGVTSLLLKKEYVERKLEQTKEHLVRAKDLLRELEPRPRSLKRHAARARSGQELEQELRAAEKAWFTHLSATYDDALEGARSRTREIDERIATLSLTIATLRPVGTRLEETARLPKLREAIEHLRGEEQAIVVTLAQAGYSPEEGVNRAEEEQKAKEKEHQKLSALAQETGDVLRKKEQLLKRTREALRTLQNDLLAMQTAPLGFPRAAEVHETLGELLKRQEALIEHLHAVEDLEKLGAIAKEADEIKILLQHLLGTVGLVGQGGTQPSSLGELREQLEKRSREHDAVAREVMEARVRLATTEAHLRAIEERVRELARRSPTKLPDEVLIERLEETRSQREAFNAEATALEARLLHTHELRHSAETELERLRAELHAAEQEKHTIELTVAGTEARKEDTEREVIARLGDAFLKDIRAGRRERPDPQMVTTLESSMRRLRGKIGEMGDTDTSVLAEEAEVEQRVTGLREQVHDLDGASAHLREGIRELDAFIHRQFSEGMHNMSEAFHAYFRQIFGGGRAGLSLVTPRPVEHALPDVPAGGMATLPDAVEDMPEQGEGSHVHELPAGVEIRATPPGKKLTSIDQLSGGEKALTSIALLFAILSQRPSPFIVLDEVDAALDEANSQRFARMLQKLARSSQFLVITHNRATMEAAGALYGITMSDDGISQLLSIRLSEVPERLGEETHIPHQHR